MMDSYASFGRWLRARRHMLDLTQDDLARRAGCSVATIRKIEADERHPSRQIAERLAGCLQIAPDQLAAFIGMARAEPYAAPATLPSGRQFDRPPNNLPASLTRLIGRKPDIAAARNVLLRGDTRLLTLLGPPGIGKTHLSMVVASGLLDAFAGGVYFVALAPIGDPARVLPAIAHTLGIVTQDNQPLVERLANYLRDKRLLMLLDNWEHLLEAAPVVAELLQACAGLTVLATSRAALHVRGERLFPVPPLSLPNLARLPPIDVLSRSPAVALFVERAQSVRFDFTVSEANAATVAAICARLDGLPLAIELAAARVTLLPLPALLARLDQRLALLTDGPRDLPPRHQTLRAAIGWSYDLLNVWGQRLFRQLGVFVGGCTFEAAEAVCKIADHAVQSTINSRQSALLEGIASLLNNSLVHQEVGGDGTPRFMMLETIREYALERLEECGEAKPVRERHTRYFVELAERADRELRGAQQKAWHDRLAIEHDNIRAGLAWSQSAPEGVELNLRLCGALGWFWFMYGNSSEARAWLEGALERSVDVPVSPAALARVLHWAGIYAQSQAEITRATTLIEASLALYRQAGNHAGLAEALVDLGRAAQCQADDERAVRLAEQGLTLFREQGHTWGIAYALWTLGNVAHGQDDVELALVRYTEALELYRSLGARDDIAWVSLSLGQIAYARCDYAWALSVIEASLILFRELGNQDGTAMALFDLGRVTFAQDDSAQATTYFAESLAVARGFDEQGIIAGSLVGLAAAAAAQGQPTRAARLLGTAAAFQDNGKRLDTSVAMEYDSAVAATQAQMDETTFVVAWAAGWSLPLEDAITEALQDVESRNVLADS
jgi:predicted ATPase/transcriptional regulator with XRE-family HTH domain